MGYFLISLYVSYLILVSYSGSCCDGAELSNVLIRRWMACIGKTRGFFMKFLI